MTLIAGVEETDDPAQTGETLARLMREHPSRAIVLRLRSGDAAYLSSRVFAQCWMPFGHRRQICCEQVELTATAASLPDLPAVVLPLAIPDLPVMLWCRSAALFAQPAFGALALMADKTIVDSAGFGLPALRAFARKHRTADLAWTRLTRWRELIAQIFENRAYLADLPRLTTIRVTHEGEQPTVSALYMGAWLKRCLPAAALRLERGPASSVSLEMAGETHTGIRISGETGVDVQVRGHKTHTVFPAADDYALLREELSIPGRDPVFESILFSEDLP
ncbi:MAG: glucose-6-phosphate dehydrogenase assembly protein OpcA [Acidobacteriota bacterium]|nr:glucose-6-phosphate dehydrogenase assembly protein OpcA [Acidobacteriota bacterium]